MRCERFETPGETSLLVGLFATDLTVSVWDREATEVEIEGRRSDDATRDAIEDVAVTLRQRAGGQEIVIREDRKGRNGFRVRAPQLAVRVRCPGGTSLAVTGGSSDVRCQGDLGAIELKTGSGDSSFDATVTSARIVSASGDVRLETVLGHATVTTASGDVCLGDVAGDVVVNTVSGDIDIRTARGEVQAQSVSGDAQIAALGGGDVRVQTVSGDVRVALAPGVAVWIDAGSVSGDVSSNLDVGDEAPGDEADRVIEVRAKAVSGDIEITRASAAAV